MEESYMPVPPNSAWNTNVLFMPATDVFTSDNTRANLRPTLRLGDSGAYVAQLQTELRQLGFYNQPITAQFDQNTENAVIAFQKVSRLSIDGIVGPNTWSALDSQFHPSPACETPAPPPPPPLYITYTVRAGDTLWQLAQQFGTTVDAIKQLNNLTSDIIFVGQQLRIPGAPMTQHTVQAGDTLWMLAQRFGTTVEEIRRLNGLTGDFLYVGQQLFIPTGTMPPPPAYNRYVVVAGDTLWQLAQRFGTTVDAIKQLNDLTSDFLFIGQELRIPA